MISQLLSNNSHTWRLFHFLSSNSNLRELKNKANVPNNNRYRKVQLGFVVHNGHSRGLTHDEICDGVIEAISNDKLLKVVGTIEPWGKRP